VFEKTNASVLAMPSADLSHYQLVAGFDRNQIGDEIGTPKY
jgi:hypothetical protein